MTTISRREFIATTAAVAATLALKTDLLMAEGSFSLPALPYALNALEPYIDAETMKLHHSKHHQAYIDKLNQEVAKDPKLAGLSLEEINKRALSLNDAVRNNAGGHYNHSFFWKIMSPESKIESASPAFLKQVEKDFGGISQMQEAMNDAAGKRFGSGWAWLVKTDQGKLAVTTTANQDNPLMTGSTGKPVIAIDVWEHAYYLKYRNKRADYLKNWWSVADWKQISQNFV